MHFYPLPDSANAQLKLYPQQPPNCQQLRKLQAQSRYVAHQPQRRPPFAEAAPLSEGVYKPNTRQNSTSVHQAQCTLNARLLTSCLFGFVLTHLLSTWRRRRAPSALLASVTCRLVPIQLSLARKNAVWMRQSL